MSYESVHFLKEHDIRKVYAKLMDVDWKETYGAYPVVSNNLAGLNFHLQRRDSIPCKVVPVIFITNATFTNLPDADIELLAKRIIRRCLPAYDSTDQAYEDGISEYKWLSQNGGTYMPSEIQFDCDWTLSTASRYFRFLRLFKSMLSLYDIKLSATIRLHQYKYFAKTGVPPVDRGMLMMYSVNDLKQYTDINSIFDLQKAQAYLTHSDYPLPLDVVLPAYSWCIVFRDRKFLQIEYGLKEDELKGASFLEQAGKDFYLVKTDTVFSELFLRRGDEIKLEKIDDAMLKVAARLSRKALTSDTLSVGLFEVSSPAINTYKHETIEEVYATFR